MESCTLFDWTSKSEVPLNLELRTNAGVRARHQGTEGFCRQVQQQRCHRDCREQSWSDIACGRSKGNGGDNQGLKGKGERGRRRGKDFILFLSLARGGRPRWYGIVFPAGGFENCQRWGALHCISDRCRKIQPLCCVRGRALPGLLRPGKICGVWIGTGLFLIGIESKERLSS